MDLITRQRYIDTYKPLLTDFVKEIQSVEYDKIPEPFLPVQGKLYDTAKTRIAFVGMETRGWGNITDFVKHFDESPEETIFREFDEFDDLEFCRWGNNFGTGFWDFNFKFLANFHGVENWKKVKFGETEEILRSFAWANTNSIERFHVTAQKKGVDFISWQRVKHASRSLDKGITLLNVLQPDIMIILNWETAEEWLTAGLENDFIKQEIDDHLLYYYLPRTKTHVLWTAHPMWLSKNKDFDAYIKYLANFLKQKLHQHDL